MNKCNILLIAILSLFVSTVIAQNQTDSLSLQIRSYAARNFPDSRTVNFYWETSMNNKYKLTQDGKTLEKGKIRASNTMRFSTSIPILTVKKFTANIHGQFNSYQFEAKLDDGSISPIFANVKNGYNYYAGGFSGTYHTLFKNKPLIIAASITGDGWNEGFGMVHGMLSVVWQVRQRPTSRLSIGMAGMTVFHGIPVMPIVSYWKQIRPDLTFEFTLPSKFYLRYQRNVHRFSAGFSMESDNFYIKPGIDKIPEMCFYSKATIKPELVYECILGKHFYLTARAGVNYVMAGGLYEKNRRGIKVINDKGEKVEEPYVKIEQPIAPFFNIGISYNLFK